jgi:hypothetical protein
VDSFAGKFAVRGFSEALIEDLRANAPQVAQINSSSAALGPAGAMLVAYEEGAAVAHTHLWFEKRLAPAPPAR